MKEAGCYFLSEEETNKLRDTMFIKEKDGALNSAIVGQSPYKIAGEAGIEVPQDTKVLVLKENGVGIEIVAEFTLCMDELCGLRGGK